MTRASVAAKMRAAKEKWPLRYCPDTRCLWNLSHGPCPKHQPTRSEGPGQCDDPGAHQPGCKCDGGEPKL